MIADILDGLRRIAVRWHDLGRAHGIDLPTLRRFRDVLAGAVMALDVGGRS
jgi:hypothetical protein